MIKLFQIFLVVAFISLASCSSFVRYTSEVPAEKAEVPIEKPEIKHDYSNYSEKDFNGEEFVGQISYYADKFHGRKTASGEIFDQEDFTAAHRSLPFGTRLLVTNIRNNNSVIVRVNDRGPFVRGRVLDVSRAAAEQLEMINSGVAEVKVKVFK